MDKRPIKVEITQDKLVDLLLHAATRDDIAKYANDAKTDTAKVEASLKSSYQALETRIDRQFIKVSDEIENSKNDIFNNIESLKADNDRRFVKISDEIENSKNDIFNNIESLKADNDRRFIKVSGEIESSKNDIFNNIESLKADNDRRFIKVSGEIESSKNDNEKQFVKIFNNIESLKADNDRQFLKIDQRYNWIIGVTIGTGVAIAGLIVGLASLILKLHP